jgi:hypothetical protein
MPAFFLAGAGMQVLAAAAALVALTGNLAAHDKAAAKRHPVRAQRTRGGRRIKRRGRP